MRIVVVVFLALSSHPAPGSRNLCPGAIIFDRLFWRDPRFLTTATYRCIVPTKAQARLGRSLSNTPQASRRIRAGYPKFSNSRSLSFAL